MSSSVQSIDAPDRGGCPIAVPAWGVLFMLLFGYLIPILPTTGRIGQSVAVPEGVPPPGT